MLKSTRILNFRTIVDIQPPKWRINPTDCILCVGSCFAQRIGERMAESRMQATVNPWGTLYNAASIASCLSEINEGFPGFNTIFQNSSSCSLILIVTLGTTHVFERDGKVVANCQKLPARLFTERDMEIDEVVETLHLAIEQLHSRRPDLKVIFTVSPYRYANWGHNTATADGHKGMHGNQLSKARLLLATDRLTQLLPYSTYFPAYEIVLDELRDYRFYDADMLHPSQQAVDYIWERFQETMLSPLCRQFIDEMEPVRRALAHRPFNPDSEAHQRFVQETLEKEKSIIDKYNTK